MSKYEMLRNLIVQALDADLNITAIEQSPNAPEPEKPFATVNAINPFMDSRGVEVYRDKEDALELIRYSLPVLTFSLTVYDDAKAQVFDYATQLHNWFTFEGYETLKDSGVVVADIEEVQDRTLERGSDWYYRAGFDVHLRILQSLDRDVDSIQEVEGVF